MNAKIPTSGYERDGCGVFLRHEDYANLLEFVISQGREIERLNQALESRDAEMQRMREDAKRGREGFCANTVSGTKVPVPVLRQPPVLQRAACR